MTGTEADIAVVDHTGATDRRATMREEVRRGLTGMPKELPPKYFYDERGSQLFEEICELPEYYQTRTERALLERIAPLLARETGARSLIELGSGSSTKTRTLLSAMRRHGALSHYVPIDLSREILVASAAELCREYEGLHVRAVVADFDDGLPESGAPGPRLVIFLGGTIGNFAPRAARAFLSRVRGGMVPGDFFLLGVDLVKSPSILNPAYNDAAGITAEFNRNVLRVINRELAATFDVESFEHYAFYDPREEQIEMHLVSTRDQRVAIDGLDESIEFYRGESVRTEISRKFTEASARAMLADAGLAPIAWFTDPAAMFALALARRGDD
jgi:L-histidine N-alpha-methyltransferase